MVKNQARHKPWSELSRGGQENSRKQGEQWEMRLPKVEKFVNQVFEKRSYESSSEVESIFR